MNIILSLVITFFFLLMIFKVLSTAKHSKNDIKIKNLCTLAQKENIFLWVLIPLVICGFLVIPLMYVNLLSLGFFGEKMLVQMVLWAIVGISCALLGISVYYNGSKWHGIPGYFMVTAYFTATFIFASIVKEFGQAYIYFTALNFITLLGFIALIAKNRGVPDYLAQSFLIIMACIFLWIVTIFSYI